MKPPALPPAISEQDALWDVPLQRPASPLSQTYIGAWFETLKGSPHYTHMSRTGIFTSSAAQQTYEMFGDIEHHTFQTWWLERGSERFGCGEIELSPDCLVRYRAETERISVSFNVIGPACSSSFRLLDAIGQARSFCSGLLSKRPAIWPFFRSRVTPSSIYRSLDVVKACNSMGRLGKVRLYEIGERLNLNRSATCLPSDRGSEMSEKHVTMGKLVSSERRRGIALTWNAARGIFPSYLGSDEKEKARDR
jgi:hypothetical protein